MSNRSQRHTQTTQGDQSVKKEKSFQRGAYALFVAGTVVAFLHLYFQPVVIGADTRNLIYIGLLPLVAGTIIIGWYRRDFLKKRFGEDNSFVGRVVMTVFYIIQGFLFSYFSLGQLVGIGWDIANYTTAKNAGLTVIECPVSAFSSYTRRFISVDDVEFHLNGNYERLFMETSDAAQYKGKDPHNYTLSITVQKGLWNHYLVKTWNIRKKQ